MKVTKATTYYVEDEHPDSDHWNQGRTNREGTHWENLMGMSWEEMEPPERLLKEFSRYIREQDELFYMDLLKG